MSFERFEECDKDNNSELNKLLKNKAISLNHLNRFKGVVNRAHLKVDAALAAKSEVFDVDFLIKQVFLDAETVILRISSPKTRQKLADILKSITQKLAARYWTSSVAGFCSITDRSFESFKFFKSTIPEYKYEAKSQETRSVKNPCSGILKRIFCC